MRLLCSDQVTIARSEHKHVFLPAGPACSLLLPESPPRAAQSLSPCPTGNSPTLVGCWMFERGGYHPGRVWGGSKNKSQQQIEAPSGISMSPLSCFWQKLFPSRGGLALTRWSLLFYFIFPLSPCQDGAFGQKERVGEQERGREEEVRGNLLGSFFGNESRIRLVAAPISYF